MAVEDAFDVRIEDSQAEKILTPRQLIDLVMSKVTTTTTETCLTHRSFNMVRRFLINRCHLERKNVRPGTFLNIIIPRKQRHQQIQQLSADLAIDASPELVRPDWLKALLCLIALCAGFKVAIMAPHPDTAALVSGLLALAAAGYIGVILTRKSRVQFPKELRTIGDLAKWVMTHNPNLASQQTTAWTRDQVAARVQEIVVKTLGCQSTYREDARFIQDLGLS